MSTGAVDTWLPIGPVDRISPSHFEGFRECALREVWAANRVSNLLPSAPAARLGSILHKLLEDAGSGRFSQEHADSSIEQRWDELVAEAEVGMQASPLEAHLVPLRKSVRGFEVERLRAQMRAREIADAHTSISTQRGSGERKLGTEVWVASADKTIGGYIDYVNLTAEGLTIRDYKSGDIFQGKFGESPDAIKESYAVQLRVYAALYAEQTGEWPDKLELVPLSGGSVAVAFDREECLKLLREARDVLTKTNAVIQQLLPDRLRVEQNLSAPKPKACRFCSYRPGCSSYIRATHDPETKGWPNDVIGQVHTLRQTGNGKLAITVASLRPDSAGNPLAHILGLTPNSERHPAIGQLNTGDIVGIFNLATSPVPNIFAEHQLTTIYKLSYT